MPAPIAFSHVTFGYKTHAIYNNLNLTFENGIYGLLGPNGAGKTTLLNLAATLTLPTHGTVHIFGNATNDHRHRKTARHHIGYLPQHFQLMNNSSVLHNVRYAVWARGMNMQNANAAALWAIDALGLSEQKSSRISSLSGGMRQRAGIACVIASQPDILILDEPTVGLDPIQRIAIRRFLNTYARERTIIISTHLVEDLASMADQVLVIDHGHVLMEGSMDDLASLGDTGDRLTTVWESGYRKLLNGSAESEVKQ